MCKYINGAAQPVNDIAGITQMLGDRISVICGYDSNGLPGTMEAGDEVVAAEAERCLTQYGVGMGYVLNSMRTPGPNHTRDEALAPILKPMRHINAVYIL